MRTHRTGRVRFVSRESWHFGGYHTAAVPSSVDDEGGVNDRCPEHDLYDALFTGSMVGNSPLCLVIKYKTGVLKNVDALNARLCT